MVKIGRDPWTSFCRVIYSGLPITRCRWLLKISGDADSTASLDNLWQCLVTLAVDFLVFRWHLLDLVLCPLFLVLSDNTRQSDSIILSPYGLGSAACAFVADEVKF